MSEEMMGKTYSDEMNDDFQGGSSFSDDDYSASSGENESNEPKDAQNWDNESDGDSDESDGNSSMDSGSNREMTKVAIDWIELEGALENNSPELHSFINIITGDVIRIFEGGENSEIRLKQAETSPDYLYVEPISSREQYHWMEEFIEIVEEPTLKDKLNIAIDGKGAFRRFKDVLVGYPAERELWFSKRSVKLRAHMVTWLTSKNVEPTNTPPWEAGGEQPEVQRPAAPKTTEEFQARSAWRENGTDLRMKAHEVLDLVPSREIPTALAFLEFLRSRRSGYRHARYT